MKLQDRAKCKILISRTACTVQQLGADNNKTWSAYQHVNITLHLILPTQALKMWVAQGPGIVQGNGLTQAALFKRTVQEQLESSAVALLNTR